MVEASPTPLISGETSDLREATIDNDAYGCHIPHWRRWGGFPDRMMATYMLSSPWWHHLWRHTSVRGTYGRLWWLGGALHVLLAWGPRRSNVASTIHDNESQRHGATRSRQRTRGDGCAPCMGLDMATPFIKLVGLEHLCRQWDSFDLIFVFLW
jgi:hypothetical protein